MNNMYSQQQHLHLQQQQQQQQQQQHHQQQQQQHQQYHQVIDTSYNTNNNNNNNNIPYLPPPHTSSIPNYNQRQSQLPPPPPLPPHHHHHQQQRQQYIVPPEAVPSATDAPPTPLLSITELADFASTMVYLMWHARRPSVMALHDHSKFVQTNHIEDRGHSKETANIANRTSTAFKKFCKQILSATQLSESVILLSLKYIAMLLQNNPNIQGAEGSEYRLFTVALMLANKFLDDNTFTNKTWSEVSGMKVTDLNIMELEFLDVLRFKLFIRKDEYERWKSAILTFRNQLLNADEAQKQEHQQHLLEETFKGIVLPNIQQQQQQQQQQQHQQQVQAQQQYQFLLMLSKAQLPQYPTQPLNRPLTRVPLRIPLQPVWRNAQQQQQQATTTTSVQPMYDMSQQVSVPPTASTSSNTDYYHTKPPTQSYDNYAHHQNDQTSIYPYTTTTTTTTTTTNNSVYQQHYSQPIVSSTPIATPSTRLSNINLTSQSQEFNSFNNNNNNNNNNNTQSTQYYKLTPTTTTTTSASAPASGVVTPQIDNSYYNRNPYTPQQPQLRVRNSFYNDVHQQTPTADYSSYDMSGSQSTNDMYSRVSTAGYQQQPYRPATIQLQLQPQPMYNTNNNSRKYNGPVPEDPLTAADSYRNHLN